ncbi:UNVERIFIED_CONTAM: hypothetical protein GTU68_052068 [Idotea baltica]|nr:hypothetical protein [Idotea baltica]
MKIRLISIPVPDQAKALAFYTDVLGLEKKHDIPVGGENRWLTVISAEDKEGPEILLEPAPIHFEPAKVYYSALYEAGIPVAQFDVDSADDEHQRLTQLGVEFKTPPTVMGGAKVAIFDDTCGNWIQIAEML